VEQLAKPSDVTQPSGQWQETFDSLATLDATGALGARELDSLGEAAWWLGRVPECTSARERAVAAYLDAGQPRVAALVALRLFYTSSVRGDEAIATGWLRRASRLLEREAEGVEHGQLRLAEARVARSQGDQDAELGYAREAIDIGGRFGDPDLVALGQYIEGRLLVKQGSVHDGMAILDDAMLAAVQGELGPMATGQVYCNVIAACQELGDVRRAAEWTDALRSWCVTQPGSVFPGLCRVHRAEVMHLRGEWSEAELEAQQACGDLLGVMPSFAAEAFYEVGEVRRRAGELGEAEAAFRRASDLGREPQPGLALVRLAQGKADAASAALRSVLAHENAPLQRAKVLPAQVEISIVGNDLDTAAAAADELEQIAQGYASPALAAASVGARGSLELAQGEAQVALQSLRRAWKLWEELDCPFEAAEARRTLGRACRALGDEEGAELAIGGAQAVFEQLGATVELKRTSELLGTRGQPGGLTAREIEVLRLVAAGKSNKEIAEDLHLSVKTVSRHLENIYFKLGVSSRMAATALAYRDGLLDVSQA
jgi:ATP/maltotriose-dependent transcriptional regulator MalT